MAINVAELKSAMRDLLKEDPYFLKGKWYGSEG